MNIVNLLLTDIKVYANNPRKSDRTLEKVKSSIKEFGFKQPIVVDDTNTIIVGHSRYLAAQELGLKEVPCLIAKDLDRRQIRAYRIADNRIAQDGEWDTDKLTIELKELNHKDFDFTKTGFSQTAADFFLVWRPVCFFPQLFSS